MAATPPPMARTGFVTGGCWCLDRNITLDAWPAEDQAATVRGVEVSGGGSGCNFAVDLRRLDPRVPVETIGLVGEDAEGQLLQAVADRHGIGRAQLHTTAAAPTHVTEAFQSRASGRRTHILYEGTSALLSPAHFDLAAARGRIFHLGLPGIHAVMDAPWQGEVNGWVAVLKKAKAAGFETNLELVTVAPQRLRDLVLPCLPHLDTLIVNDHEIGALADTPTVHAGVADVAACQAAARQVLTRGAMRVVVVHYVEGAVLVRRDGRALQRPSVQVPDAARRGVNGAGDAFAAGFLYGMHAGWDDDRCLTLAHAAAAACIRSVTPTESIESVDACLALAQGWGWR